MARLSPEALRNLSEALADIICGRANLPQSHRYMPLDSRHQGRPLTIPSAADAPGGPAEFAVRAARRPGHRTIQEVRDE